MNNCCLNRLTAMVGSLLTGIALVLVTTLPCAIAMPQLEVIEFQGDGTSGIDINDAGEVLFERLTGNNSRSYVWHNGIVRALQTPLVPTSIDCPDPGVFYWGAFGRRIAPDGSVAGEVRLSNSSFPRPVIWSKFGEPTVIFGDEQAGDPLRFCSPRIGFMRALNSTGRAAGYTNGSTVFQRAPASGFWVPLPSLESSCNSRAYDVNEAGFIVGSVGTAPNGGCESRPAMWTPEGNLVVIANTNDEAIAINSNNVVLARRYTWDNGVFDWFPGAGFDPVQDLSDSGVVLAAQAVRLPGGDILRVEDLIPIHLLPPEFHSGYPGNVFFVALNNNHDIVGYLNATPVESRRAFVLRGAIPIASCLGDTNGDGIVNFADLNAVLSDFGQTGQGLAGDVNADGIVNFADLNLVLSVFGSICP